jgi:hypothetical protein
LVRALEAPQSISAMPDQKLGERSLPAVSIKGATATFIVLFDRTTHLPAAVRTRDADNVYGDSDYDMILSDWKSVGATKRAHTLSFQLGGREVQRLTLKEVTVDAPIPRQEVPTMVAPARVEKVFTSGFGSPWCALKVKDEAALILTREIQAGRSVRAFHDFAGENFGVHSSSVKVTKRPASVFSPVDSTQETKNAERSKIEEARCK